MKKDSSWMQQAYQLALKAQAQGEVPIGAVLVSSEGELLGEGYNSVITLKDPTAHAEILAIKKAAFAINNYRLTNTTLYVTLEPCCMCAGAIIHSRISRIVFATRDFKAGAAGSVYNLLKGYPLNHSVIIDEGILESDCSHLLRTFFRC